MAAVSMLACAEGGSATSAAVDAAFTGSGAHHRTVATRSEQAQSQFDLGLASCYCQPGV